MTKHEINLLAWNIQNGGLDKNGDPNRKDGIQALVNEQREDGVDTIGLSDTFGWQERYGSNDAIAKKLGYGAAYFTSLADDRIDYLLGKGAGITFATNHTVEQAEPLDLDNRQGFRAVLDVGGKAVQCALMYLDDMNEDTRLRQLRSGLNELDKSLPTVIMGDLNLLPSNMGGASLSTQAHDAAFRIAARVIGRTPILKNGYYGQALSEMNRREGMRELESRGWREADSRHQPTIHKKGLGLQLDHILYNPRNMTSENFQIIPANGASDHNAIRTRLMLQ